MIVVSFSTQQSYLILFFEHIINTDKNPLSIEILDFYITMSFIYSFTILPVHIMYMSFC